ncbi:MAG TPA: hypothetical protein VFA53_11710 [Xanthobacteraceae bacterium]|nr:hypothetical protein [Xanthobacteraceae bacterium]
MYRRIATVLIGLAASTPVFAGEMKADEARRFVVGKLFGFNCFEGTRGSGRINADGSVSGTVQFAGEGPYRHVTLPAGTLQVKNETVCASVQGLPFQPCFYLEKTDNVSFRGSIYGLSFAYCNFNRHSGRANFAKAPRSIAPPSPPVTMAHYGD